MYIIFSAPNTPRPTVTPQPTPQPAPQPTPAAISTINTNTVYYVYPNWCV